MDEMSETKQSSEQPIGGRISEMGMLNLMSAKTADDLKGITSISEVGVILIPEHLATELAKIPMSEVGTIAAIPTGENVQLQTGQIHLSGESLAAGDPETSLVVVGQVFIETPVTSVGFKKLHIYGQSIALRGSEAALGAKLGNFQGQNFYVAAKPRIFMGDETIGREFLELLPEPCSLIIMGQLKIEGDVTAELMKNKVLEILLMGQLLVPRALVPLAQVLATTQMGSIQGVD